MTSPTLRESQVAQAIIAVLRAEKVPGRCTIPHRWVPLDGYLASAPLMAFGRGGIPTQMEVEAWLELNRAELILGNRQQWRGPVRLHFQTLAPGIHVLATTHRVAQTGPHPAVAFKAMTDEVDRAEPARQHDSNDDRATVHRNLARVRAAVDWIESPRPDCPAEPRRVETGAT